MCAGFKEVAGDVVGARGCVAWSSIARSKVRTYVVLKVKVEAKSDDWQ